jgi:hypothetical protein
MAKKTSKTHLERVVRRGRVGAVEVPLAGGVADVLEVEVDALVAVLGHHGGARPAETSAPYRRFVSHSWIRASDDKPVC